MYAMTTTTGAMGACCPPCARGGPCASLGGAAGISTHEGREFYQMDTEGQALLLQLLSSQQYGLQAPLVEHPDGWPEGSVEVFNNGTNAATAWIHNTIAAGDGIIFIEGDETGWFIPTRSADVAQKYAGRNSTDSAVFAAPRDGWEQGAEFRLAGTTISRTHMVVGGVALVLGLVVGKIL